MFTKNSNARKRGRPAGRTAQGTATERRLFEVAVESIAKAGYEAATLRDVAERAGVSVGLLYRYFPSKRAIVLALYDRLSAEYAAEARPLPPGPWHERGLYAIETSLRVLDHHRAALQALTPLIVSGGDEGLFAAATAPSRKRVQEVFHDAVVDASDAPRRDLAVALGRLLYMLHLAILLWWLLDKSPRQRATRSLVTLLRQALPSLALTLRVAAIRRFAVSLDGVIADGLLSDGA